MWWCIMSLESSWIMFFVLYSMFKTLDIHKIGWRVYLKYSITIIEDNEKDNIVDFSAIELVTLRIFDTLVLDIVHIIQSPFTFWMSWESTQTIIKLRTNQGHP